MVEGVGGVYEMLGELATTPAASGKEELVRDRLRSYLDDVDLSEDRYGNLHGRLDGAQDGRVLLCAHQDKIPDYVGVMEGGPAGNLFGFATYVPAGATGLAQDDRPLYVETGSGYVPADVTTSRVGAAIDAFYSRLTPDETLAGEDGLEQSDVRVRPGSPLPGGQYRVHAEPLFADDGAYVHGKLDDTVGLSIITDLLRDVDPGAVPDIDVLYTVEEETGLRGASRVVEERGDDLQDGVDRIIVVETSPTMEPGDGIVLYEGCNEDDGVTAGEAFVDELVEHGANEGYPLTVKPAMPNDALALGRTGVPTAAVETPIRNMHSPRETVAKQDIDAVCGFLESYLEDFSP